MKYICLVPKIMCKTPIHITIYDEKNSEDGEPVAVVDDDFKCNYQDSAKTVLTQEQKLVQITGSAFLCGDIAPNLAVISDGEAVINGVKRKILSGTKARNPNGTVNYTKLELI